MIRRFARLLIAPAVILTAGACFATRGDVRILQGDIARLQLAAAQAASADTARALQLRRIIQSLSNISDTLRIAGTTLARFQGDVSMSMRNVQEQLLTVQELTGQSRKQVESLRAQLEARAAEQVQTAPPAAAPTAAPGTVPPTATQGAPAPGPYQLMDLGRQQLARGATSAARAAFSDLLTQYPTSDLAPEAQYWIAEAYASAGSAVEADSVFALVADKYPTSERAPVAIYKRAVALKVAGQTRQARLLLQQVIDKYPKSEAATLASALLRDLK
ncbi:MAG: tetratricopeptide repeat protein [Gemmatimonadetes bacterium]|nr:tetratricopeptide repeat protein [Gemmatimonadota bacterium]